MIIVKNRELLIPNNERYIGTTYDNDTENRVFQVPRFSQRGVDLAALTFRLDIQYANEAFDTVLLDKEVGEAFIILIWRITSATLQVPGTLYIGIRAVDSEATVKWSSFSAAMYAERHLNTPGNYGGSLTEIEQIEQDHVYMKGVVDELKSNLDYAHDAEAWAKGTRSGAAVPSTDKTYHNNSKYYSDQASAKATQAANSATAAANSATQAAETVSDTNTRFNNAVEAVTSETEVIDARVGADGTQYTVLKNRLDAEHNQLKNAISDIIDYKRNLNWVRGTWNGGNLLIGSAYNKRRATSEKITATTDLIISMSDYSTYRYEITYFDASGNFTGVSYWATVDRQINAGTMFALTLGYVDESAHAVVDEVENDLWNALTIYNGINHASTRKTVQELTEGTKNLLSVTNVGKTTQPALLLDLGADTTFADGVVFSFELKNATINSASNAIVDLQKADGTHQYCIFNKMVNAAGEQLGAGTHSGRYYSTYDIYPRGVTFRYVYLRYSSTAVPSGEIVDCMLTSGQDRNGIYADNLTGIDYVAREPLADMSYYYEGEPLDFRKKGFNTSPLMQIPAIPSGTQTRQGFAVYGGIIFQLYNPDKVTLVDMTTRASIATFAITSEHGDTADFSNEFYADDDEFPLMYVTADTTPAKVYVNRVTRSGATLVRTYYFPDTAKTGYYAGHSLDAENGILYLAGYSQASYTDDMAGANKIIVSKWDLRTTVTNADQTLTPEYIEGFEIPFISTVQGQAYLNGKMFLLSSNGSSPHNSKIIVVDVFKHMIVSRFEDLPPGMEGSECEGLGFVYDTATHKYNLIASGDLYHKFAFN